MRGEILDTMHEVISILQCAEDAAEDPVKTALSVANGLLLGAISSIEFVLTEDALHG